MYEQVYFHKTTRAAEKLIQLIFVRVNELINHDEFKIDPSISKVFNAIVEEVDLLEYIKLDDFLIISQINNWAHESSDELLKRLCKNFVERNLFKMVDEEDNARLFSRQQYEDINNFFNKEGLLAKYFYVEDDYTDVPYKDDYLFGKKRSEDSNHIWLQYKNGDSDLIDLAEASDIIKSLRNNLKIKYRGYCDRSVYNKLIKHL